MQEITKSPKPSWATKAKCHDGNHKKCKTLMTIRTQNSWWKPQKVQNHHDQPSWNVMLETAKSTKPSWPAKAKHHGGNHKKCKTIMTSQDQSPKLNPKSTLSQVNPQNNFTPNPTPKKLYTIHILWYYKHVRVLTNKTNYMKSSKK